MEKSGVNNGYYFITPAEFEHVEDRFKAHLKPVYEAPAGIAQAVPMDRAVQALANRIELVKPHAAKSPDGAEWDRYSLNLSEIDWKRVISALRASPVPSTTHSPPAPRPVSFLEAMNIVEHGFDTWKDKPHNAKWYSRIDGTPIPNDLKVNIAEAICHSSDGMQNDYVVLAEEERAPRASCGPCGGPTGI